MKQKCAFLRITIIKIQIMKNRVKGKTKDKVKNKVKELLSYDNSETKESALNILYLKYRMICDTEGTVSVDSRYKLRLGIEYDEEIRKIEIHFGIKIDDENPFTHEVIKSLESEGLVETSDFCSIKMSVTNGIGYLRNVYSIHTNLGEYKKS